NTASRQLKIESARRLSSSVANALIGAINETVSRPLGFITVSQKKYHPQKQSAPGSTAVQTRPQT
ncbi:hypothetical protein M1742_25050, partial [Salmonella enterica subsp. enterica serovar Typhimurium]|uniref:hypothetical protein n=1 Tax=Salmonella enterica TaxID=28901 RepID=UPI0021B28953